jgi:UDP-N-acetylglucosamine 1-carboxyvinyltransferase
VPKFVVQGGVPLNGTIRPAGNKNAALPMLTATLLTEEEVILENVPRHPDVRTLMELLGTLGAEAEWIGPNEVRVRAADIGHVHLDAARPPGSAPRSCSPGRCSPAPGGCASRRPAAT